MLFSQNAKTVSDLAYQIFLTQKCMCLLRFRVNIPSLELSSVEPCLQVTLLYYVLGYTAVPDPDGLVWCNLHDFAVII